MAAPVKMMAPGHLFSLQLSQELCLKAHLLSHLNRCCPSRTVHNGSRDTFPVSAFCRHKGLSTVATPFLLWPTAFLRHHRSSCPTGAVHIPTLTLRAVQQRWRHSKSQLQLGRTSHPNPWDQCRERGVKKKPPIPELTTKPHQSLRRKTHQLLCSPSAGFDLPSILNPENCPEKLCPLRNSRYSLPFVQFPAAYR